MAALCGLDEIGAGAWSWEQSRNKSLGPAEWDGVRAITKASMAT